MSSAPERQRVEAPPRSWERLSELPGAEFIWIQTPREAFSRMLDNASPPAQIDEWFRLLSRFAQRMGAELHLGQPRVMVTIYEAKLSVVGLSPGVQVGLILRNPSTAGLAMVAVREWMDRETGDATG